MSSPNNHLHGNVDKVKPPFELLKTEWVHPLVENATESSEAETKSETLGSDVVG